MSDAPYHFLPPRGRRRPVLISAPHVGTAIPGDIAATMRPEVVKAVADTDWLVHELYGFAAEMGIALIHARYSRYVIDLNRDPSGKKLYSDGRAETTLVPVKTFAEENIYAANEPTNAEVMRRQALYYSPYHERVKTTLGELRKAFGAVLFFDAHSIKRVVKSIRPEPFPDLILGDQRQSTAAASLSTLALEQLRKGGYDVAHNDPFMGGFLTRSFGKPNDGVHALQLEMAQDVYLFDDRVALHPERRAKITKTLQATLAALARAVEMLP